MNTTLPESIMLCGLKLSSNGGWPTARYESETGEVCAYIEERNDGFAVRVSIEPDIRVVTGALADAPTLRVYEDGFAKDVEQALHKVEQAIKERLQTFATLLSWAKGPNV